MAREVYVQRAPRSQVNRQVQAFCDCITALAMPNSLDLFRATPDAPEWLGSFLRLRPAIEYLKETQAEQPGRYFINDQETGETLHADESISEPAIESEPHPFLKPTRRT